MSYGKAQLTPVQRSHTWCVFTYSCQQRPALSRQRSHVPEGCERVEYDVLAPAACLCRRSITKNALSSMSSVSSLVCRRFSAVLMSKIEQKPHYRCRPALIILVRRRLGLQQVADNMWFSCVWYADVKPVCWPKFAWARYSHRQLLYY